MAKWLINQGGVEEIEKMNIEKAGKLYDFIDNSKIFKNNIKKEDRSLMNVIFLGIKIWTRLSSKVLKRRFSISRAQIRRWHESEYTMLCPWTASKA